MDTSTVKVHLRNGLFTVDSLASIISQFCKRNRVQKSFSACKKTLKREEKKTSIKKINYKYWLVFARRGCKRKSTGQRICEQKQGGDVKAPSIHLSNLASKVHYKTW